MSTTATRTLYERFAARMLEATQACLISVWSVDPVREKLVRLLVLGDGSECDSDLLDSLELLAVDAVRRRECTISTGLNLPERWRSVATRLAGKMDLNAAVAVPVRNTSNPNQLLLVFVLCPGPGGATPATDVVIQAADNFALAVESHLSDRCVRLGRRLNIELSKLQGLSIRSLATALAKLARNELECDAVLVFLEESLGAREELDWVATSKRDRVGANWDMEEIKRQSERVWRSNRELLVSHFPAARESKSEGLVVPLRDLGGQPRGAICCINWENPEQVPDPRPFSYNDAAVVEALGDAFAARLELHLNDQKKYAGFGAVRHELHVPVTALAAVIESLAAR